MSHLLRIKKAYPELNPGQRRIADLFLSLSFEELNASIDEIARRAETSVASISRFSKKLGFESFQHLKISLSREMREEKVSPLPLFLPNDEPDLVIRKVFAEAAMNLQDTEQTIDFDLIRQAGEAIGHCDTLSFLGMGGSGGVAVLGNQLFTHLGYRSQAVCDPYAMLVGAGHAQPGQVLIGISHTGRTRSVVDAVAIAGENGAETVGITNYAASPLAETARLVLFTACYEGRVHIAQSNSIIPQVAIINLLYLLAASRSDRDVQERLERIEQSIRHHLRIL